MRISCLCLGGGDRSIGAAEAPTPETHWVISVTSPGEPEGVTRVDRRFEFRGEDASIQAWNCYSFAERHGMKSRVAGQLCRGDGDHRMSMGVVSVRPGWESEEILPGSAGAAADSATPILVAHSAYVDETFGLIRRALRRRYTEPDRSIARFWPRSALGESHTSLDRESSRGRK